MWRWQSEFVLLLSQYEKLRDLRYTLAVYSTTAAFTLGETPPTPPHRVCVYLMDRLFSPHPTVIDHILPACLPACLPVLQVTVSGCWGRESAGGNTSSRDFFRNPQYRLCIYDSAAAAAASASLVHVELKFAKEVTLSLHITHIAHIAHTLDDDHDDDNCKMFWCMHVCGCLLLMQTNASISVIAVADTTPATSGSSSGDTGSSGSSEGRVDFISAQDERLTSGSYRPGYCYCQGLLAPGWYTIVLSTFAVPPPQSLPCNFLLAVSSHLPANSTTAGKGFAVFEIPPEGAAAAATSTTATTAAAGTAAATAAGGGFSASSVHLAAAWSFSDRTAAGCSNYKNYSCNPTYEILVNICLLFVVCVYVFDSCMHVCMYRRQL